MEQKLVDSLIKIIITIPGITGLAPLDVSLPNTPLKKEEYSKSFIFEEKNSKFSVSMALIVNDEIPTKTIAEGISASLQNFFKKRDQKLGQLNIYVRGIK